MATTGALTRKKKSKAHTKLFSALGQMPHGRDLDYCRLRSSACWPSGVCTATSEVAPHPATASSVMRCGMEMQASCMIRRRFCVASAIDGRHSQLHFHNGVQPSSDGQSALCLPQLLPPSAQFESLPTILCHSLFAALFARHIRCGLHWRRPSWTESSHCAS